MDHHNGNKCRCSVFKNKNISLKILAIHKMVTEIEKSLLKCRYNTENLKNKYKGIEKFIFHAKVTVESPSMYKSSFFITECSIFSLLDILKIYLDSHYFCFIEMFDKKSYENLKVEFFQSPYCVNYVVYPLE